MTPISPVAESEILLSSLHRQLKAVADHPEHYWIGQILLDTLKRETGYTADARPSDPAQEPEAAILPAETVAWAFIDHHQAAAELHGPLTDLVRRARNDTRPVSLDREALIWTIMSWSAKKIDLPPFYQHEAEELADALIEGRT